MYDKYESPLSSRYASDEMLRLFSQRRRVETWRRLWTELARAEHELGLPITAEQVAELKENISCIDFNRATSVGEDHFVQNGLPESSVCQS